MTPIFLIRHGEAAWSQELGARWIGLTASDGALFRLDTGAFSVLDVEHESADEPSFAGWNIS